MATFKKLSLPKMTLPYSLGLNDPWLPLGYQDKQLYNAAVGIDEYTWVTLSNGVASESIKVGTMDYLGNIPILARGATPLAFMEGACADWGWSDAIIAEMYPESGLDFVDSCGKATECACDMLPKTLVLGQPASIIVSYSGAPTSRTVAMNIAGLSFSTTNAAVSIDGTPTVAGTYALAIKITKGGLSRTMNCSIVVKDPALESSSTSGC